MEIPSNYEDGLECGRVLTVPTLLGPVRYADVFLTSDSSAPAIWQFLITKFASGGSGRGVLISLPTGARLAEDDIGFLRLFVAVALSLRLLQLLTSCPPSLIEPGLNCCNAGYPYQFCTRMHTISLNGDYRLQNMSAVAFQSPGATSSRFV